MTLFRLLVVTLLVLVSTTARAQTAAPASQEKPPVAAQMPEVKPTEAPAPATEKPETPKPAPVVQKKPPAERKMEPVDEGSVDPTWVAFRNRLLAALKRGDKRTLLTVVDRNILNGLEAPRGITEFRKIWELDGKDERLVKDLASSLALGSAWYKPEKGPRLLCAPYVPLKWPLDDVDPYDSGAITIKDAVMRSAPTYASQALDTLSFDIVEVRDWEVADAEPALKTRWVKVRFRERDGFVPDDQIRSAIEHRACFAKQGGAWRMVEYVVGIEFLGGE